MTGQLSKLGDIVHKLSQDIRLSDNTTDAQRKEFNNKLSSTSAELIKISGIVSRLEFITGLGNADLTDIPGESEPLTQKLSNTAEQLAKLSDTVNKLKFTTGLRDSGPDDISGSVIPLIQKLNNTTEQLNKLTEMVGRLEFITGLKDSSPDNIPEGAEPLTQRLTNTTGQLNKLSEMVGRLSQDIKLSDTTTDAQRKEFGSKLNNTVEQLSRVNNRLDKLDIVTGIKESGPNNLPGNPEPLNKKLINTTEQLSKLNELVNKLSQDVSMSNVITDSQRKGFNNKLSSTNEQLVKLSDIVSKLSQDIKQSETATDAQKKEFSQLLTNLQEAQKRLVATIEEHHIAFNKDLELLESRIENTLGIPGDNEPLSQKLSNTNEQLAKLSNIVGKLEFVIGFKDDDSAGIPVDAEPLTRKLNNTAEQLNKLTDMVGKLSQDVIASETTTNAQRQEFSDRLNNTTEQLVKINDIVGKLSEDIGQTNTATDAQKKEFSESLTNLQEAQSRLAAVIDEHRDTIKKNLEGLESRIDKTQKIIEGLGETQNENKPKPTPDGLDSLSLIPQLKTGLERVGEQITSLQAGVAKAQALAVRTPTDDLVIINMANGTKHTFRIYRGKRGLSKPHRVGVDQVHGEKYVDLSEPED
jgi:chromosome segregation ATPase